MANKKRLIDANELFKAIKSFRWFGVPNTLQLMFDYLKIIIKEQPTVDAVEVVRCQDCMWFDLEDELPDVFRSEQYCYCTEANTYVPINHFCSFGERRTDA